MFSIPELSRRAIDIIEILEHLITQIHVVYIYHIVMLHSYHILHIFIQQGSL